MSTTQEKVQATLYEKMQGHAQSVLAILDPGACNSSGVVHFLNEVVSTLWEVVTREGMGGTDWVNSHPLLRLCLCQLCQLAEAHMSYKGFSSDFAYVKALAEDPATPLDYRRWSEKK